MEALELLGSRYIKPEQVAVGPVETLRAQNAATWRTVYIHRVSTTQETGEQANLLKLLTTALVRSSEAKRLVLDFGEEQGFWNVVTESEPQCESLRDWLQAEVDGAEKGEAILTAEQAAAMGEFARLFAGGVKQNARKAIAAKPIKAALQSPSQPKAPETVPVTEEPVTEPPTVQPRPTKPARSSERPLQVAVKPVVAETAAAELRPPVQRAAEVPVVFPDDSPAIVISAPPPVSDQQMASPSTGKVKSPLEDAYVPPSPPKPPDSPPPVTALPIDPPVAGIEPITPEIVAELPKTMADAPKIISDAPRVVSIDARPLEPKADAQKPDAIRSVERTEIPTVVKAVTRVAPTMQNDAPLFANSMPKAGSLSKMTMFFIILGIVALLLVIIIVYLSTRT